MFMLLILKMLRLSDIPVGNDQVNNNLCFFFLFIICPKEVPSSLSAFTEKRTVYHRN